MTTLFNAAPKNKRNSIQKAEIKNIIELASNKFETNNQIGQKFIGKQDGLNGGNFKFKLWLFSRYKIIPLLEYKHRTSFNEYYKISFETTEITH